MRALRQRHGGIPFADALDVDAGSCSTRRYAGSATVLILKLEKPNIPDYYPTPTVISRYYFTTSRCSHT
jgi:hypothetical protein